jgi:hypothetical protein
MHVSPLHRTLSSRPVASFWTMSVSTVVGFTVLTRMKCAASSRASSAACP